MNSYRGIRHLPWDEFMVYGVNCPSITSFFAFFFSVAFEFEFAIQLEFAIRPLSFLTRSSFAFFVTISPIVDFIITSPLTSLFGDICDHYKGAHHEKTVFFFTHVLKIAQTPMKVSIVVFRNHSQLARNQGDESHWRKNYPNKFQ